MIAFSLFSKYNIDVSLCPERPSSHIWPTTVILVNNLNGSRSALYGGQDVSWPTVEEFKQSVPSFKDFSWVHFELMNDWQFERIYAMIQWVKEGGRVDEKEGKWPKISVELERTIRDEWMKKIVPEADMVTAAKGFAQEQGDDLIGIINEWQLAFPYT